MRLAQIALELARERVRRQRIDHLREAISTDAIEPADALNAARELMSDDAADAGELSAIASYAATIGGLADGAAPDLADAVSSGSAAFIGSTWATLLSRPRYFAEVVPAFGALPAADRAAAEVALSESLGRLLGLGDFDYAVRRPIELDLSPNLLPENPEDPNWPLLARWIPEVKAELSARYGITLPGVSVSVANYDWNQFVIRIDHGVVGRWEMTTGGGYVADELRSWVTDIGEADPDLSPDPLHYVALQLGVVLRRHLARFVTVDELDRLARSEGIELEPGRLIRLRAVAANLLEERVPLLPIVEIVEALDASASAKSATTADLVDFVRVAVRERLPGNQGETLIEVPPEIEAALAHGARDDLVAIIPQLMIPGWYAADSDHVAVVCAEGSTRRGLRRLLADHDPDATVLTIGEVVPR